MRIRFSIAAAVVMSLAAGVASAQAAPLTTLKVRSCHAGDSTRDRQATFFAQMHALPRTSQMSMRFTVYQRTAGRGLQPVSNSDLQQWRRSRPGVHTYGYTQTVTGLQTGSVYVMGVEYRWLDASGRVLRSRKRISSPCIQTGPLPNLTIAGVAARSGASPGTESYSIRVVNDGSVPALGVSVDIFVDSTQADTARIDRIDPGATVTVRINGPACSQRVRAAVDRLHQINETTDDDNQLRSACPAVTP